MSATAAPRTTTAAAAAAAALSRVARTAETLYAGGPLDRLGGELRTEVGMIVGTKRVEGELGEKEDKEDEDDGPRGDDGAVVVDFAMQ